MPTPRAIACALSLVAASALAGASEPAPPVDEIVARARAVMEKLPAHTVCRLRIESVLVDKSGKVELDDKRDARATLEGHKQDIVTERAWRNGKELSAAELAEERRQAGKRGQGRHGQDVTLAPWATRNAAVERFELVRKETLWGRPAYVLRLRAVPGHDDNATLANGTMWVDAERFVELKGELEPAKLPPHADWVKVQEQFELAPDGVPLPTFLHLEGGGHMLFIRKQFRTTLRWNDCR